MTNLLGLIMDGGLAMLLIVTIGYCSRLSRRIRTMQESRGELAAMIAQFDQATGRAMSTLAELQATAKRITEALQLKIEKANFLADDLAFLIEKSSKLTAQLEEQLKSARPEPAKVSSPTSEPAVKPKLASWQPSSAKTGNPSSAVSVASLEALLSRLASPTEPVASVTPKPGQPSVRTSAERELLAAIKPGRQAS